MLNYEKKCGINTLISAKPMKQMCKIPIILFFLGIIFIPTSGKCLNNNFFPNDSFVYVDCNPIIEIDSINSKITVYTNEEKKIKDSLIVFFDEYFENMPIILYNNKKCLFKGVINTFPSIGFAKAVYMKRNIEVNILELRMKNKIYTFHEKNKYNYIHISMYHEKLRIVFTNKSYEYD